MTKSLTVKEVSKILCIGLNQTYALMKSKGFPSYRINNKYFVTEENLCKWRDNIKGRQILLRDD